MQSRIQDASRKHEERCQESVSIERLHRVKNNPAHPLPSSASVAFLRDSANGQPFTWLSAGDKQIQ